ncbi:MAG TPA: CapA family protein [Gemmatimonadales bacterium]|nr:CapA family protein [Gemmatimonadales bacterium]
MLLLIGVLLAQAPHAPPRDSLHILAVGDINLGRKLAKDYLEKGDTLYPFRAVLDTFATADLLFGNLESPIAPDSHTVESEGIKFTAPLLAATSLARAGFTIVSTANNHAWDGGEGGVLQTMNRLSERGVRFVGSGYGRDMAEQPVIIERHGWRIGFFAVTRAWNPAPDAFYSHEGSKYVAWGDPTWLYPAIAALKASGMVDLVVVSVHGGTEYQSEPKPSYQHFLEGLADAGADLVLAHHPHVLQPVVFRHGTPIVQSLGNFVFSQTEPWTRLSAILRITVAPNHQMKVRAIPVRAGYQVTFVDGTAADSVRARLRVSLSNGTTP